MLQCVREYILQAEINLINCVLIWRIYTSRFDSSQNKADFYVTAKAVELKRHVKIHFSRLLLLVYIHFITMFIII